MSINIYNYRSNLRLLEDREHQENILKRTMYDLNKFCENENHCEDESKYNSELDRIHRSISDIYYTIYKIDNVLIDRFKKMLMENE